MAECLYVLSHFVFLGGFTTKKKHSPDLKAEHREKKKLLCDVLMENDAQWHAMEWRGHDMAVW